ncbi:T9SS type A sorting domain-containing protein [Ferruginibacter sp.]
MHLKKSDHFEVERSTDNYVYNITGMVNDAVKLNEAQSFTYTDDITGIGSDIIYYRLKVFGKEGEVKYSSVLVVRVNTVKTAVSIVPNPASDYVTVKFFVERESAVLLKLVDNMGKVLLQQTQRSVRGNNVLRIDGLGKFSAGVYTLQVLVNNEVTTQKLIVSK